MASLYSKWGLVYQFEIEETIGFDVKASFASRPLSRLIRWYNKPGGITKKFWEKAIQFHGAFHGLKITKWYCWMVYREWWDGKLRISCFLVTVVLRNNLGENKIKVMLLRWDLVYHSYLILKKYICIGYFIGYTAENDFWACLLESLCPVDFLIQFVIESLEKFFW